jgi:hypothetical protein
MAITLWMMEDGEWREAGRAIIVEVLDDRGTLRVKLISVRPVGTDCIFVCDRLKGEYFDWSELPLVSGPCPL